MSTLTCKECSKPIERFLYCDAVCRRRFQRKDWKNRNKDKQKAYVKKSDKKAPPSFAGVDCESINGLMVLLTVASTGKNATLESIAGEKIGSITAMDFLISQTSHGRILVGFWFDYDVNLILSDLEFDDLRRLAATSKVYWKQYRITHIPGKMFRVYDRRLKKGVTIWDLSSFVRTSFVKLLKEWQITTEDEITKIAAMKDSRSVFAWEHIKEIKAYNISECVFLAHAAKKIWKAAKDAEIPLRSYYGSGSLASGLLQKHKMKSQIVTYDSPSFNEILELAYFGGRFETSIVGKYPKSVYCYDINSAYPYAITKLPCLQHGRWIRKRNPELALGVHYVTWKTKGLWGPFPVRFPSGSLRFPSDNPVGGWYWNYEIEAAMKAIKGNFEIVRSILWVSDCDCVPFDWMHYETAKRLKLKAQGSYAATMLKLGLNSVYGKLAQKVGQHPYQCLVWAGMITSMTRAMLLDAIRKGPVLSMATDSIFSTDPLILDIGDELGQWQAVTVPWMLFAQGGVHFWPNQDGMVQKSRGFTGKQLTYESVQAAYDADGLAARIDVPQVRFRGYRTAIRRLEPQWLQWVEEIRTLSLDPKPRRFPYQKHETYHLTRSPTYEECVHTMISDLVLQPDLDWSDIEALEQPEPTFYGANVFEN